MGIKHTPGYEITRDGRVFSTEHNWRGYGRREITQDLNASGYPSVRISVNGKRKRYAVHVLVAENHLPPRPTESHEVRHLDGNKLNSNVSNLAWGTPKENAEDRDAHGRTSKGCRHSKSIKESSHADAVREFRKNQKAAIAKAKGEEQ